MPDLCINYYQYIRLFFEKDIRMSVTLRLISRGTPAYVSIREHTLAYVTMLLGGLLKHSFCAGI
jgi:hypothetical protein